MTGSELECYQYPVSTALSNYALDLKKTQKDVSSLKIMCYINLKCENTVGIQLINSGSHVGMSAMWADKTFGMEWMN